MCILIVASHAVPFRLLWIGVELTGVTLARLDRGDIWRIDVPAEKSIPRHFRKPRVGLDVH